MVCITAVLARCWVYCQDFGNNTILVPPPDHPESIQCRLFLSHVEDAGASFAVVPHPQTVPFDAEDTRSPAELYASERLVRYRPGTVVMYRADTYHRGTPAIEGSLRRTHGFVFRRADCDWVQGPYYCNHTTSKGRPQQLTIRYVHSVKCCDL
jgi:hypothetical protein